MPGRDWLPAAGAGGLGAGGLGRWSGKQDLPRLHPCSPAPERGAFLRREGTQTDITLHPESSPMKATREAITAAVAALEASRQRYAAGDAEALLSIRRIAGRIRDAALNGNLMTIAQIASALLESHRADEIDWLAQHLSIELNVGPDASADAAVILVIEDDRLTAKVMAEGLSSGNRTVLVAHTAADGEKLLADHEVSLLLLDLVLPDADGRDVLVRLRARPELRGLPIIVITALDQPGTHSECITLGADGVLTKPV